MQNKKVSAIRDWPLCRSITEVRTFMGLSEYYRQFVKDFFVIAAPLYDLIKKEVDLCWTQQCQQVFEELNTT